MSKQKGIKKLLFFVVCGCSGSDDSGGSLRMEKNVSVFITHS